MSDNAVEYKSENPNGGRIYQARMLEPFKPRDIDFELDLVRNFDKDTADSVVKQVEEARKPLGYAPKERIRYESKEQAERFEEVRRYEETRTPIIDTYIIIDMITPSKHIAIIMNKETDKELRRYTLTVNGNGKLCMN